MVREIFDALHLALPQFAFTVSIHVTFPANCIGMAGFTAHKHTCPVPTLFRNPLFSWFSSTIAPHVPLTHIGALPDCSGPSPGVKSYDNFHPRHFPGLAPMDRQRRRK
ncbi:hypothetical protein DF046_16145 [Burkholderia cepacia]|nr:hypothetical protein DF046_16145 [Burkholderia cepacia]